LNVSNGFVMNNELLPVKIEYAAGGIALPHIVKREGERTTTLYIRTSDAISLDEIERIMV
jgi:hypothetical protein